MNILSIQSHVVYGHVGNSAAVFPLQRIGVEVWPVHTVQFSNHTGYGHWRGEVFGSDLIRLTVQGLDERGVLSECDGVISGYLGSRETGEAVIDAVTRVKRANPSARYCCDPVIGERERGIFVSDVVPQLYRERILPLADLAVPNQFELELLAGHRTATMPDLLAAIDAIRAQAPGTVFVTSLATDETPADSIDLVAAHGSERYLLRLPRIPIVANGAGDAIAALFFARYMMAGSVAEALSLSASAMFGVLSETAEAGASEMRLVEAQAEFVTPSRLFAARQL